MACRYESDDFGDHDGITEREITHDAVPCTDTVAAERAGFTKRVITYDAEGNVLPARQVTLGWLRGHAHLQSAVDAISDGTAEPVSFRTASGRLVSQPWYNLEEFEFIATNGHVRLYERSCSSCGRSWATSHRHFDEHPKYRPELVRL